MQDHWKHLRELIIEGDELLIKDKLNYLGFNYIKTGSYGIVFAKNQDTKKVSKIGLSDSGYSKYIKFCQQNKNNQEFGRHLLNVNLVKTLSTKPLVEYYSIERLKFVWDSFNDNLQEKNLERLLDIYFNEYKYDRLPEFVQFIYDTNQSISLRKLIDRLHHIESYLDLHMFNYMIREKDKSVVITDPFVPEPVKNYNKKRTIKNIIKAFYDKTPIDQKVENVLIIY
jgi:hypothetical protein